MSREGFGKKAREKAKREKAQAKQERRESRPGASEDESLPRPPEATVLAALAALQHEFDSGSLDFDEYEHRKQELTMQLEV